MSTASERVESETRRDGEDGAREQGAAAGESSRDESHPERRGDVARPPEDVEIPPHVVLYDGVCGLCSRAVRWLLERDVNRELWFAPLQGETAAVLRARHPSIPDELASVVYVSEGRVYLRSKVFLHAARHLSRPWRWAYAFRWLPAWPLDLLYGLVARVRYRVFGKFDVCTLPTTDERAQLLP